jgi:Zn-finger nucleic acid-binding protein
MFHSIEVDRCTDCQGIFFDEFEKERLQAMKGSDSIDIGDADVGREFNRVDRIFCPRCTGLMIRMVDVDQHHIWFEHCTVCGGSFLDAGEFRDLAHHTVVDYFKDMLAHARH